MIAGKRRERFAQINSRTDRNAIGHNDHKFSFDNAFDRDRRLTTGRVRPSNSCWGRKAARRGEIETYENIGEEGKGKLFRGMPLSPRETEKKEEKSTGKFAKRTNPFSRNIVRSYSYVLLKTWFVQFSYSRDAYVFVLDEITWRESGMSCQGELVENRETSVKI